MINLLTETLSEILAASKTPEDIIHIGGNGYGCSWDEFVKLANVEYNNGYGSAEIAENLTIVFSDKSWLERAEYDGSEWWQYKHTPEIPETPKPIKNVLGTLSKTTLKQLNP